jgi:ABC-type amino acid transport substrate-binding protein
MPGDGLFDRRETTMSRMRGFFALLALLALVATACGDDGGGDAQGEGGGEEQAGSGITIAGEVDTDELYGIGVQDDAAQLQTAINAGLAQVIEDGTYEEIYSEWFPNGDVSEQLEAINAEAEGGEMPDASELELQEEGTMLVGSDIAFAPFEFVEDGENKGFDIDLMNAIAERIGVEVEFVNTSFDTIFTQLSSGQFDAIISGITITPERDEEINFSNPYFSATQGIAVPAGSDIAGVEDLAGKQVGVQTGTTGEAYANENFTDAEIVSFPTSEAAFGALVSGQLDAVFIDLPVASNAAEGEGIGEPSEGES